MSRAKLGLDFMGVAFVLHFEIKDPLQMKNHVTVFSRSGNLGNQTPPLPEHLGAWRILNLSC